LKYFLRQPPHRKVKQPHRKHCDFIISILPEHARTTTILKTWKDRKKIIQLVWMFFFFVFFLI
jgi:hypothetical protein